MINCSGVLLIGGGGAAAERSSEVPDPEHRAVFQPGGAPVKLGVLEKTGEFKDGNAITIVIQSIVLSLAAYSVFNAMHFRGPMMQ